MSTPAGFPIPAGTIRVEDVVQGSRFIATVGGAATAEGARAFIDAVRAEYPDATHNCWAYVAGPPGSTASIGMSDAGEPHGTAGRPMLDVLLHSGVGEIVAVVTRYFGGTKLGKGGLVRAYGGAVQHALAQLQTTLRIERVHLEIVVGYSELTLLRRLLEEYAAEDVAESFTESVHCTAAVPRQRLGEFERAVAELSAGRGKIRRV